MRDILFRGQCEATNEWVYGLPVTETTLSNSISHIAQYSGTERKFGRTNVKIKPETTGQFTGLKDKNGVKVFEGDKIKIWNFYHQSGNTSDWFGAEAQNSQPCYEEFLETMYATVEFKNGCFVAKNANNEIPLIEVVKGLGSEVSNFYWCGYGGSERDFIECLNDESYGENYYNELTMLEGEHFYNRLEEIVNIITKEIEIINAI